MTCRPYSILSPSHDIPPLCPLDTLPLVTRDLSPLVPLCPSSHQLTSAFRIRIKMEKRPNNGKKMVAGDLDFRLCLTVRPVKITGRARPRLGWTLLQLPAADRSAPCAHRSAQRHAWRTFKWIGSSV